MHHWRSNVEAVPKMLRDMGKYQLHAAEWLAHLVDVLATRPYADVPIPFVAVCDRLAHRPLPNRDNFPISRELGRIHETHWNVRCPKISVGNKGIENVGHSNAKARGITPR